MSHSSRPWWGQIRNMSLYLSHASKRYFLSFCLKQLILALRIAVLLCGKYRARKTFFNSFHVVTELDGRDSIQALALSRNEKEKIRSLIASRITPFAFSVSVYCTNTDKCKFGSSVANPENWLCWTSYSNEGFNLKLFQAIAGVTRQLWGSSYDGAA